MSASDDSPPLDTDTVAGLTDADIVSGAPAIAGYRDFRRLGSGGYAMVFQAHQKQFDRQVAVKILTVELDDKTIQRFLRECQATGKLSGHPNVVTVLDAGVTTDGRPYMTTQLMERGAISDWTGSRGAMPVGDVLQIGVKICGALAAVHAAGILHRDIKPQNILVSRYGEPALADFGISAVGMGTGSANNTMAFTAEYTAPEVLNGTAPAPTMDVYSLGATLYALLAGQAPFVSGDNEALLPFVFRILNEPVPLLGPEVAPALVMRVLQQAMAKDPSERYPDAASFGQGIQECQSVLGLPVTPIIFGSDEVAHGVDTAGIASLLSGPLNGATSGGPAPGTFPAATPGPTPAAAPKRTGAFIAIAAMLAVAIVAAGLLVSRAGTTSAPSTVGAGPNFAAPGSNRTSAASVGAVAPNPDPPTTGRRLRLGVKDELASLATASPTATPATFAVAAAVLEPLVRLNDDGSTIGVLAESMVPDAAFGLWTITLRPGITFHDGTEFDAEATKANLDNAKAGFVAGPSLRPVDSISVTGPHTLVVSTRVPWPAFPATLAAGAGWMVSPATLATAAKPAGTGPFQLTQPLTRTGATLDRFAGYRANRPFLDGIDVKVIADENQRANALGKGELDIVLTSDPDVIDRMSTTNPEIIERDAILSYLALNTEAEPLDDARVRQAMSMAVDRIALTNRGTSGLVKPALNVFANTAFALPVPEGAGFDRTAANTLVSEVTATNAPPGRIRLATVLQADSSSTVAPLKSAWQDVGLATDINTADGITVAVELVTGKGVASLSSFVRVYDPDQYYQYFHSSAIAPVGSSGINVARLADAEIDRAFDAARSSADPDERRRIYAEILPTIEKRAAYVGLSTQAVALVASKRVTGLTPNMAVDLVHGGRTPWLAFVGIAP